MGKPSTYAIPSSTVSQTIGDEIVIVDLESETYFGLNAVGALIWTALREGLDLDRIVETVVEEFDVAVDRATADVRDLLEDLRRAGLLRPVR